MGGWKTGMNTEFSEQVRSLAHGIWRSAGQDSERAFDYWLMAEQMVLELVTSMARVGASTAKSTAASMLRTRSLMASLYLERVRDLSYQMWEAGGQQYGRAMDYWIAAERHVSAMMMTQAQASPAAGPEAAAKAVESFSATEHLERIRLAAYYMWEKAGRQYGDSLEYWLAAERQILESLGADVPPAAGSATPDVHERGSTSPGGRGDAAASAAAPAGPRPRQGRGRTTRANGKAGGEATPSATAATPKAAESGEATAVVRVRRLGPAGTSATR
ncbi:MAG: DUF2934 domain-containing protein [Rhodospirillales bacterium]|nr:MAG: DUF2934 domain-containing protein [Rhodospirillales bacterium]